MLKPIRFKKQSSSGKMMASLSKLSKAFMLPIALLPVAGLMLGIGSTIMSQSNNNSSLWWIGNALQMVGNIPFTNLPALFAISIAIAYTNNAGAAGLTAFVGWLAFNALIAAFVKTGQNVWEIQATFEIDWERYPNHGSMIENLSDTSFDNYVFTMANHGYIPPHDSIPSEASGFGAPQQGMKDALAQDLSARLGTTIRAEDITIFEPTRVSQKNLSYNLLFWQGALAVDPSIVTPILGIGADNTGTGVLGGSLNTGVFGGIIVGGMVAFLYNKYYQIQLPRVISFFGGIRFVPIITFICVIPLALVTMMIWPGLGILLNNFGKWTGTLPLGLDSFVFGLAKRALLPFGLHHVFYAPLWWSGAGGQLSSFISAGDVNNAATLTAQGDQSMMMAILADGKLKIQDVWNAGLHVGRFQSGEFAMMMFALPAMAAAMWWSVPKENRKAAMGIYFGSALTAFLTGITEPLEFTFLFVIPQMYYLVHVPIFASSYMLANITGIKVGMTFSGGLIDWIIFGIIPISAGHDTRFWLVPIEGLGYAAIEFAIFYLLLRKYKWNIPGMENIENLRLFTKKDVQAKRQGVPKAVQPSTRVLQIIEGLGGLNNLANVDACATRLRVSVENSHKVNTQFLKSLGAVAVVINNQSIQAIFGGEADNIKSQILKYQNYLQQQEKQQQKKLSKVV